VSGFATIAAAPSVVPQVVAALRPAEPSEVDDLTLSELAEVGLDSSRYGPVRGRLG
jgi:hypothetical protein